jgi:uncharacterized RDD family membrane protein YckC
MCSGQIEPGKTGKLYGETVCARCPPNFATRRAVAYFLDNIVYLALFILLALLVTGSWNLDEWDPFTDLLLGIYAFVFLLFLCKDGFAGYSPMKRLLGLRVYREDTGKPIGPGRSLCRNLGFVIPFFPLIMLFQLSKGHRIGDLLAGTRVVWTKYAGRGPFALPPHLPPTPEATKRLSDKAATPVVPRGGAFTGVDAETLAKGLRQVLEGGKFEPVSTTSAEDAVAALFDKALAATPNLSIDAVESHFDMLKGPWCSQKLIRGSRDRIRSVVLENLRRIQSEAGFRDFTISVELTRGAAQLFANVRPYAIPLCVWRSGDVYLACGNSDFRG